MELQKQHFGERPGSGRSLVKFVKKTHFTATVVNWPFGAPEATFCRQSWKGPFVDKACIRNVCWDRAMESPDPRANTFPKTFPSPKDRKAFGGDLFKLQKTGNGHF